MLNKTLLSSAAVIMAVAGAQAADLPSKKAAPATYVKICDTYGAGFFTIPGTDTCVKLGGYARAEYQYTPGKNVGVITPNAFTAASTAVKDAPATGYTQVGSSGIYAKDTNASTTLASVGIGQVAAGQSTTGMEVRGRIDVDARTPTSMGAARTFIRMRAANTSGIRNTSITNNAIYGMADASTTGITLESAMVQWAGFTFGVAPENYAMMPTYMYGANPWTGFPNGMKQIAYTATLGGGYSATVAIEDKADFGYSSGPSQSVYLNQLSTAANIVANVRLDQAWGFAAVHGMVGNNSVTDQAGDNTAIAAANAGSALLASTNSLIGAAPLGFGDAYTSSFAGTPSVIGATAPYYGQVTPGQSTQAGWAIGSTISIKLPMIASGDQVWFGANYGHGMLGAILSTGGLSNMATASAHRLLGGIQRVDQNLMLTGGSGTSSNPYTVGTVNAWNINAAYTHYWAAQWRSNFTAGYVAVNTPTSTAFAYDSTSGGLGAYSLPQWGNGKLWEVAGSLIYSPAKDFDIGLELQYANIKNSIQNTANAVSNSTGSATTVGGTGLTVPSNMLSSNNISAKLRVERSF